MAITGPIIPAKSTVPGAVPSASTTITDTLVTPTTTEIPDRAVQIGEIVTNVADGKLWLKKADETFAPLTRTKTLATWYATQRLLAAPATQATARTTSGSSPSGNITDHLEFSSSVVNLADFMTIIPEGSSWNSLGVALYFTQNNATPSGIEWTVSLQKVTFYSSTTFSAEVRSFGNATNTAMTRLVIPITSANIPTGLTATDLVKLRVRRYPAGTNDISNIVAQLYAVELFAI